MHSNQRGIVTRDALPSNKRKADSLSGTIKSTNDQSQSYDFEFEDIVDHADPENRFSTL